MSSFHRRFERYLYAPVRLDESHKLFSVKVEQGLAGTDGRPFADAVYIGNQSIAIFAFMSLGADGLTFPMAYRGLGEDLLGRVAADVARCLTSPELAGGAKIRIYGDDRDLAWLSRSEPGAPPMLGLSSYDKVFAQFDDYEVALSRVMLGDILDANAGLGDGALLLRRFSGRVDAVSADERVRTIASRLGRDWLLAEVPKKTYACALALDCLPQEVAQQSRSLRAAAPDGVRLISSSGDAGREALAGVHDVLPIFRAGYESSGPTGRWIIVDGDRAISARETPPVEMVAEVAPRALSILFVLRPSAETMFGGDVVQVQQTANALRRRGHRADVTTSQHPSTDGYDIVHLSNLTSVLETLEQARHVKSFAGPIALMPIFMDHADETIWGMETATACFKLAPDDEVLENYIQLMSRREITANNRPQPPLRAEPFEHYEDHQRQIIACCDYMVANAYSEVHRIYRLLGDTIPFSIAPSGSDPSTYGPSARDSFVDKYGLHDFILCTGRLEARKNQLLLLHALRDTPYKVVLIGRNAEEWYGALIRAYRSQNTLIIPQISEQELAGAYAAARVLAMPSWDEVVSLSSLNGAICEASLVLTRNGYEHEYFGASAFYCDPGNAANIRERVIEAWDTHEARKGERRALAQRVRVEFNWDRAAEITEQAYYAALRPSARRTRRLEAAT